MQKEGGGGRAGKASSFPQDEKKGKSLEELRQKDYRRMQKREKKASG